MSNFPNARSIFNSHSGSSGVLTSSQFYKAIKDLNLQYSFAECFEIYKRYDVNNSFTIEFSEFEKCLNEIGGGSSHVDLTQSINTKHLPGYEQKYLSNSQKVNIMLSSNNFPKTYGKPNNYSQSNIISTNPNIAYSQTVNQPTTNYQPTSSYQTTNTTNYPTSTYQPATTIQQRSTNQQVSTYQQGSTYQPSTNFTTQNTTTTTYSNGGQKPVIRYQAGVNVTNNGSTAMTSYNQPKPITTTSNYTQPITTTSTYTQQNSYPVTTTSNEVTQLKAQPVGNTEVNSNNYANTDNVQHTTTTTTTNYQQPITDYVTSTNTVTNHTYTENTVNNAADTVGGALPSEQFLGRFDNGNKGYLTKEELRDACNELGVKCETEQELTSIFEEIDIRNTGNINKEDFDEFYQYVTSEEFGDN